MITANLYTLRWHSHMSPVREILPELVSQIIQLLTSDEIDQQEVIPILPVFEHKLTGV